MLAFIVFLSLSLLTAALLMRVSGLGAEISFLVTLLIFLSFIQKAQWKSEERLTRQAQEVSLIGQWLDSAVRKALR